MKPETRQPTNIAKRVFATAAVVLGILSLSGCITSKVLELRQARAARVKEATNFWSLAAVRSGHVVAGTEAFACVEFRDSPGYAPQAYTINLSQASRIGRTFADFMPATYEKTGPEHESETSSDLVWRLYPLEQAQEGCGDAGGESPFPVAALKIDTLQIRREDQQRLLEMLLSSEGGAPDMARLFEVSFAPEDNKAETSGAKDIILVYLPPIKSGEKIHATGVAGAFEPGSEWVNPYTLLVAPAVAADTVIITTVIMAGGMRR